MNTQKREESYDLKIIIICVVLALVIFAIDLVIPLGVAGGVPYILVVLLALWSPRKKMPFYAAIGGSLLTVAGFYLSPEGGVLWKVMFNRFLALFAIWTTAVLSVQRTTILAEREKALLDLKVLSGMLPICASCKKIRDDGGAWNQMESYVRDHSEAEFSHGICPDCAQKLYPELDLFKGDDASKGVSAQ